MTSAPPEAPRDCTLCPRLAAYREENRAANPAWYNGAVPSFGDQSARIMVLGLAPGRSGANRTGRPFTGDYAGQLLFTTLTRFGFANGRFDARLDDGLELSDVIVANAVRCAPPKNKPLPTEIATCRLFLLGRIFDMSRLRAIVCLGRIAHDTLLRALGARTVAYPFAHSARHEVAGFTIFDSYHCSRYNTSTGRLTPAMFEAVFSEVRAYIDTDPS